MKNSKTNENVNEVTQVTSKVEDGKFITSMEVAEMVEKEHKNLMRDIRTYLKELGQLKIEQSIFFKESTYKNKQNKIMPCYNITKKGCEFIAHKLTGLKGIEFTAKYIERFHEMEEPSNQNKINTCQESKETLSNAALPQANQSIDFKEFLNDEFGKIRALNINGEPWFVGKDVAEALGYADTFGALKKHVPEEDKLVCQIDSAGQRRNATVVNESGLYALIFGSKLESAKEFKHWVTSEVLPSIRKTGKYSLSEPKADSYLIEDPAARARRWAEEYEEKKQLLLENNELKPKAKDWEQFLDTKGTFSILDIAHAMNIGRSTLFAMLRDVKICFKNEREENIPYEKPVHKDKFTTCIVHKNGVPCTQMRVYPKGLSYITKKLREKGYIDGDKEKYVLSYFKTLEEQKSYSACAIA